MKGHLVNIGEVYELKGNKQTKGMIVEVTAIEHSDVNDVSNNVYAIKVLNADKFNNIVVSNVESNGTLACYLKARG